MSAADGPFNYSDPQRGRTAASWPHCLAQAFAYADEAGWRQNRTEERACKVESPEVKWFQLVITGTGYEFVPAWYQRPQPACWSGRWIKLSRRRRESETEKSRYRFMALSFPESRWALWACTSSSDAAHLSEDRSRSNGSQRRVDPAEISYHASAS